MLMLIVVVVVGWAVMVLGRCYPSPMSMQGGVAVPVVVVLSILHIMQGGQGGRGK